MCVNNFVSANFLKSAVNDFFADALTTYRTLLIGVFGIFLWVDTGRRRTGSRKVIDTPALRGSFKVGVGDDSGTSSPSANVTNTFFDISKP